MPAILVFLEGTICDTRPRHHLGIGTPEFYRREALLKDLVVPGSVACLQQLAGRYEIVYLGARPASTLPYTKEWLESMGFPKGAIYLGETHSERLALVKELTDRHDFVAGIGDRWDDNEIHTEIGCLSIILKEFEGNWPDVPRRILKYEHQAEIDEKE